MNPLDLTTSQAREVFSTYAAAADDNRPQSRVSRSDWRSMATAVADVTLAVAQLGPWSRINGGYTKRDAVTRCVTTAIKALMVICTENRLDFQTLVDRS